MKKVVGIIPTYNEAENIAQIIERVHQHAPEMRVLVVDDNSPDGTADIVRTLMRTDARIMLLFREEKEGLGKAYLHAFSEVLKDTNVEWIQIMDADFSHDPKYLPNFFEVSEYSDLVIGSRYIREGGMAELAFWRRMLSRFASQYCHIITKMPIADCTAGFMLIRADLLRTVPLSDFDSSGFAFLMELKHALWKKGARITESSIIFGNRGEGKSKLTKRIVIEGMIAPWRMRLKKSR
jgi:dolichol-phosphate mannosyltransferase